MGEHGSEGWLLDNGASMHICPFKDEFVEIRSLNRPDGIMVANGETVILLALRQIVSS